MRVGLGNFWPDPSPKRLRFGQYKYAEVLLFQHVLIHAIIYLFTI